MSKKLVGRRVVFLVTEDWYFLSHRLPIARAARDVGMDVHVITRVERHGDAIRKEGFTLHPLSWHRRSGGVGGAIAALVRIRRLLWRLRPDLLHAVALKAVVFGAISNVGLPAIPVFAITGLGFAFTENSARAVVVRAMLLVVFRVAVDRSNAVVLLQNDDDKALLKRNGFVRRAALRTIRGSGVDTVRFAPMPSPIEDVPTIAVVSRMIAIKGIADLVAASQKLQTRGAEHRLMLVGNPDAHNPSAIPAEMMREWSRAPWIDWLQGSDDVREVWAKAHIAALTSLGGEGLPKTLLEAAACGRPLVATDVPGSRDVVVDAVSGFLVPPQNPDAIANALGRLIEDSELRARMGTAARRRIEACFSQEQIAQETLALYADWLPQIRSRERASA